MVDTVPVGSSAMNTTAQPRSEIAPELNAKEVMIVNLSGRGDKDVNTVAGLLKEVWTG